VPEYTAITYELADGVARITLNRPEAANSLNEELSSQMLDAIIRSEDNQEVRVLIISGGSGRFFCAGADLKSFYSAPDVLKSKVSLFHVAISHIVRAPFPVIAAVNGTAAGGGMGLACSCDMIVAGESAKFIMAYTRRGLTPDGTTTYFLPRRIGVGRAKELLLLGGTIDAAEAQRVGLVNRVSEPGRAREEADALAARLAGLPAVATAAIKRSVGDGAREELERGLDLERDLFIAVFSSSDASEGVRAFLEKRPPSFTHR